MPRRHQRVLEYLGTPYQPHQKLHRPSELYIKSWIPLQLLGVRTRARRREVLHEARLRVSLRARLAGFASQGTPITASFDGECSTTKGSEEEEEAEEVLSSGRARAGRAPRLERLQMAIRISSRRAEDELLSDVSDKGAAPRDEENTTGLPEHSLQPTAATAGTSRVPLEDELAEPLPLAGPSRSTTRNHNDYRDEISSTALQVEMTPYRVPLDDERAEPLAGPSRSITRSHNDYRDEISSTAPARRDDSTI